MTAFPFWFFCFLKNNLTLDKPLVCQRICPTACKSDDLRPAVGTGMHFYVSHRPSIQHGRSTALASSLVALPASLGLLRPVSATGGGLRAPLRFACAVFRIFAPPSPYGGAVFRRCGRPLGVSSRLQPLRGLRLRTSCARHFSPSGLHLFASVCSAKNARNDVHAVISD